MINAPKESILRAGLDASEYTRGAAEIDRANEGMARSGEQVEQSQARVGRSLVSTQSSIDRLEASLDKGFAAQRRYETAVDRVNAAVERGRITQDRGAELISLAQTKYLGAASATAALGAATAAAATQGRNFGAVAQQAGYQIGDFASQVAAGGSAVTAFVQQGSQMLGMFGMFGAVAGAALAIGGVAYQMWAARDAAKATKSEIETLTDAIKKFNEEAEQRAAGDPGDRARRRLAELEGQLREAEAIRAALAQQGIGGRDDPFGAGAMVDAGRPAILEAQIKALREQIPIYDALRKAAADRTQEEREQGWQLDALLEKMRERRRQDDDDARQAEENRKRFMSDVDSLVNVLDPAAAATRRWFDQQTLLNKAVEQGIMSEERRAELRLASDAAYRRATEQTVQVTEVQIRATREADSVARDLGLTFQSAFEDAIVRGEKLRGVLGGIAQDIARIIVRQTVTTPLAGLATSAISGIGGLISGLLAGPGDIRGPGGSTSVPFGGPRAMGGPVSGGTAYLVGEQGPELFMPGSSGRIIPNGQTGGTVVNQTINISVGVAQTVRAEIAALMPAIKRQTVDAVADARMRGGSFAAAMGT
jgi:hypothetical protein